ncbi:hypothetical protein DEO72_LG7g2609 [Vigna unguiculata]|uniref:Uncharacterized protein n=1 Tax=Vigna unguiculata TaxID=3917 RepID=A0A4D6MIU4_VIGUN|nr:hypothetical protein DEO72_LG7g2609 [Vigna unguiculata]
MNENLESEKRGGRGVWWFHRMKEDAFVEKVKRVKATQQQRRSFIFSFNGRDRAEPQ